MKTPQIKYIIGITFLMLLIFKLTMSIYDMSTIDDSDIEYAQSLPSIEEIIYGDDIAIYEKEWIEQNANQQVRINHDSLDAIYYPQYLEYLAEERMRDQQWRDSLPLEYYIDSLYIHGADLHTGNID